MDKQHLVSRYYINGQNGRHTYLFSPKSDNQAVEASKRTIVDPNGKIAAGSSQFEARKVTDSGSEEKVLSGHKETALTKLHANSKSPEKMHVKKKISFATAQITTQSDKPMAKSGQGAGIEKAEPENESPQRYCGIKSISPRQKQNICVNVHIENNDHVKISQATRYAVHTREKENKVAQTQEDASNQFKLQQVQFYEGAQDTLEFSAEQDEEVFHVHPQQIVGQNLITQFNRSQKQDYNYIKKKMDKTLSTEFKRQSNGASEVKSNKKSPQKHSRKVDDLNQQHGSSEFIKPQGILKTNQNNTRNDKDGGMVLQKRSFAAMNSNLIQKQLKNQRSGEKQDRDVRHLPGAMVQDQSFKGSSQDYKKVQIEEYHEEAVAPPIVSPDIQQISRRFPTASLNQEQINNQGAANESTYRRDIAGYFRETHEMNPQMFSNTPQRNLQNRITAIGGSASNAYSLAHLSPLQQLPRLAVDKRISEKHMSLNSQDSRNHTPRNQQFKQFLGKRTRSPREYEKISYGSPMRDGQIIEKPYVKNGIFDRLPHNLKNMISHQKTQPFQSQCMDTPKNQFNNRDLTPQQNNKYLMLKQYNCNEKDGTQNQDDPRFSSNTTKKQQFETSFRGGSVIRSNFKVNEHSVCKNQVSSAMYTKSKQTTSSKNDMGICKQLQFDNEVTPLSLGMNSKDPTSKKNTEQFKGANHANMPHGMSHMMPHHMQNLHHHHQYQQQAMYDEKYPLGAGPCNNFYVQAAHPQFGKMGSSRSPMMNPFQTPQSIYGIPCYHQPLQMYGNGRFPSQFGAQGAYIKNQSSNKKKRSKRKQNQEQSDKLMNSDEQQSDQPIPTFPYIVQPIVNVGGKIPSQFMHIYQLGRNGLPLSPDKRSSGHKNKKNRSMTPNEKTTKVEQKQKPFDSEKSNARMMDHQMGIQSANSSGFKEQRKQMCNSSSKTIKPNIGNDSSQKKNRYSDQSMNTGSDIKLKQSSEKSSNDSCSSSENSYDDEDSSRSSPQRGYRIQQRMHLFKQQQEASTMYYGENKLRLRMEEGFLTAMPPQQLGGPTQHAYMQQMYMPNMLGSQDKHDFQSFIQHQQIQDSSNISPSTRKQKQVSIIENSKGSKNQTGNHQNRKIKVDNSNDSRAQYSNLKSSNTYISLSNSSGKKANTRSSRKRLWKRQMKHQKAMHKNMINNPFFNPFNPNYMPNFNPMAQPMVYPPFIGSDSPYNNFHLTYRPSYHYGNINILNGYNNMNNNYMNSLHQNDGKLKPFMSNSQGQNHFAYSFLNPTLCAVPSGSCSAASPSQLTPSPAHNGQGQYHQQIDSLGHNQSQELPGVPGNQEGSRVPRVFLGSHGQVSSHFSASMGLPEGVNGSRNKDSNRKRRKDRQRKNAAEANDQLEHRNGGLREPVEWHDHADPDDHSDGVIELKKGSQEMPNQIQSKIRKINEIDGDQNNLAGSFSNNYKQNKYNNYGQGDIDRYQGQAKTLKRQRISESKSKDISSNKRVADSGCFKSPDEKGKSLLISQSEAFALFSQKKRSKNKSGRRDKNCFDFNIDPHQQQLMLQNLQSFGPNQHNFNAEMVAQVGDSFGVGISSSQKKRFFNMSNQFQQTPMQASQNYDLMMGGGIGNMGGSGRMSEFRLHPHQVMDHHHGRNSSYSHNFLSQSGQKRSKHSGDDLELQQQQINTSGPLGNNNGGFSNSHAQHNKLFNLSQLNSGEKIQVQKFNKDGAMDKLKEEEPGKRNDIDKIKILNSYQEASLVKGTDRNIGLSLSHVKGRKQNGNHQSSLDKSYRFQNSNVKNYPASTSKNLEKSNMFNNGLLSGHNKQMAAPNQSHRRPANSSIKKQRSSHNNRQFSVSGGPTSARNAQSSLQVKRLTQEEKEQQNHQNEEAIRLKTDQIMNDTIRQDIEGATNQCKRCKCRNTKCLKLYCECLRNNQTCGPECHCMSQGGCHNRSSKMNERRKAVEDILKRNIDAFENKVDQDKNMHFKGCKCKASECQKKYCECFERGVPCTNLCKCTTCRNPFGNIAGKDKKHHHGHGDKMCPDIDTKKELQQVEAKILAVHINSNPCNKKPNQVEIAADQVGQKQSDRMSQQSKSDKQQSQKAKQNQEKVVTDMSTDKVFKSNSKDSFSQKQPQCKSQLGSRESNQKELQKKDCDMSVEKKEEEKVVDGREAKDNKVQLLQDHSKSNNVVMLSDGDQACKAKEVQKTPSFKVVVKHEQKQADLGSMSQFKKEGNLVCKPNVPKAKNHVNININSIKFEVNNPEEEEILSAPNKKTLVDLQYSKAQVKKLADSDPLLSGYQQQKDSNQMNGFIKEAPKQKINLHKPNNNCFQDENSENINIENIKTFKQQSLAKGAQLQLVQKDSEASKQKQIKKELTFSNSVGVQPNQSHANVIQLIESADNKIKTEQLVNSVSKQSSQLQCSVKKQSSLNGIDSNKRHLRSKRISDKSTQKEQKQITEQLPQVTTKQIAQRQVPIQAHTASASAPQDSGQKLAQPQQQASSSQQAAPLESAQTPPKASQNAQKKNLLQQSCSNQQSQSTQQQNQTTGNKRQRKQSVSHEKVQTRQQKRQQQKQQMSTEKTQNSSSK